MTKKSHLKLVSSNETSEIEIPAIAESVNIKEVGKKQKRQGKIGGAVTKMSSAVKRSFEDTLTSFPGSQRVVRSLDEVLRSKDADLSLATKNQPVKRELFNDPIAKYYDSDGNGHALHSVIISEEEVFGLVSSGSKSKGEASVKLVEMPYGRHSILPSDRQGYSPEVIDSVKLDDQSEAGFKLQHSRFDISVDPEDNDETYSVTAKRDDGCVVLDNYTFVRLVNLPEASAWQDELYTQPATWTENL